MIVDPAEMTCQELVELVTDYLEGALSPTQLVRFEEHLAACPACPMYIEQLRATIRLVGRLTEEHIAAEARDELLGHFRAWRRTQS